MSNTIGNFIFNNVKGIRSSEKRLKISEYLKNNIHHNRFVFLQETYSLTQSLHIIDKKSDENGRILIIDAKVNDEQFLLVNLYNSHTESEQIKTLDTLKILLEDIENISGKKVILGGDLNLIFDCSLETCGGNPVFKKKSLTKFIEIKESLNLCGMEIKKP